MEIDDKDWLEFVREACVRIKLDWDDPTDPFKKFWDEMGDISAVLL